jgi:hypothetical protein
VQTMKTSIWTACKSPLSPPLSTLLLFTRYYKAESNKRRQKKRHSGVLPHAQQLRSQSKIAGLQQRKRKRIQHLPVPPSLLSLSALKPPRSPTRAPFSILSDAKLEVREEVEELVQRRQHRPLGALAHVRLLDPFRCAAGGEGGGGGAREGRGGRCGGGRRSPPSRELPAAGSEI